MYVSKNESAFTSISSSSSQVDMHLVGGADKRQGLI